MAITVRLEPSGKTFSATSDESVLHAALRQGIVLPYSCENGSCGSCKAKVISGTVDLRSYDKQALSAFERDQCLTLLCRAIPKSDLVIGANEAALAGSMPPRILPARIARIERLATEVMGLWLRLPKGEVFQFSAGQHLEVLLRDGARRCYSLANSPEEKDCLELHVRHVQGGRFSELVFGTMKPGDLIRIRGPLGTFGIDEQSSRPAILLAGGTGFAPIKSIIEHIIKKELKRVLHIYWGARTSEHLYFQSLVVSWIERYDNISYTPVLSEPDSSRDWKGRIGLVHNAVHQDHPDLAGYSVYACGPPAMISSARALFCGHGLAQERFHADAFTPALDAGNEI